MSNQDTAALWRYHEATQHSYQSVRSNTHFLDWDNYPLPFKIYPQLEPIPLPREWPGSNCDAFSAISAETAAASEPAPDLRTIATILYHAAGITRHRSFPGGELYFRAAACTGALYEVEIYLACGRLDGLEAGLYHFNPLDFALRKLRDGDWRGALLNATANEPAVAQAPAILICTGTYWRNAWKYQARTYRHFFWDNGTMLANLLAMAAGLRLPARLVMGFVDEEIHRLLSLDTRREVAISLVALGKNADPAPLPPAIIEPLAYETVSQSNREVDYPLMRSAHAASSLATAEEVASWRAQTPIRAATERERLPSARAGTDVGTVDLMPPSLLPQDTIEQVILRRGSTRRFATLPIQFEQLSTMLIRATQGIPADFLNPTGAQLNDLYLIVNAVEGLPAGAYFFQRHQQRLELLKPGNFRSQAGRLGLEQGLPADASVDIFFLADLKRIMERFGNRGYRAAQIEAGILGGKLYLGAYAQKLGATGLTFYDDEVTDFFSPHAKDKSAIFLVAIGVPAKRKLPVL